MSSLPSSTPVTWTAAAASATRGVQRWEWTSVPSISCRHNTALIHLGACVSPAQKNGDTLQFRNQENRSKRKCAVAHLTDHTFTTVNSAPESVAPVQAMH